MPQKNKFHIEGDVKLKVLHEKETEKTTLTLYLNVPKDFMVVLKDIETIPEISDAAVDKKPVKEVYKQIQEEYPPAKWSEKKNEFLKNVSKKYDKDWRKIDFQSTFNFCIVSETKTEKQTQYLHYQIPGFKHEVNVNISACDIIAPSIIQNLIFSFKEKPNK